MILKQWFSVFEIILLVSVSVAISYQIDFSEGGIRVLSFAQWLFSIVPSVSALEVSDFSNGVSTCKLTKTGAVCQEFPSSECALKCAGECIPAVLGQVGECALGTCYDPSQGVCSARSPSFSCEGGGGQWFNDPLENIPQCKRGCCLVGDEARFVTGQQCIKIAAQLGKEKVFKEEIQNELSCLGEAQTQEEGACVFEFEFQKSCVFSTRAACVQKTGNSLTFYSGKLCSHPDLGTVCEKQRSAQCVKGKDGLYWFDSCGNRENIYDSNRERSWNAGNVLPREESCSLSSGGNPLSNQRSCGNCDYLLGSICGAKTSNQRVSERSIGSVCKDLRCTDEDGKKRQHGESWCVYQGSIGVDVTKDRATDVVGSRHFKKICRDGEIIIEPCADFRNEVCVGSSTKLPDGDQFSEAACRLNRWQQCLEYNTRITETEDETTRADQEKERDELCVQNSDCFLKKVNIDDGFRFNLCTPKYPPGFNLEANAEGGELSCQFGTQTCTAVYVKKLFGGWKCEANCHCEDAVFVEQMNNVCMSLGDCGAKVNIAGDLTKNFRASNSELPGPAYYQGLEKYTRVVPGKVADPGRPEEFFGGFESALEPGEVVDGSAGSVNAALMASGALGVAAVVGALAFKGTAFGAGSAETLSQLPLIKSLFSSATPAGTGSVYGGTALYSFGGAVVGAALGLAVTGLLIKFLKVGPGLNAGVTYALLVGGAYSGAVIGVNLATSGAGWGSAGGFGASGSLAFSLGIIIAIAVIAVIIIAKLLGVGKTKKVQVPFQCQPWQAPVGGEKCAECGTKGLPCSRYACQSLGQTCTFINEGSGQEECIDSAPNDVAAPVISPLDEALQVGFRYVDARDSGVVVEGEETCIKAYTPLSFGIELNEPGQCRFDTEHTADFDSMAFDFGGRNLFIRKHTTIFSLPSLDSLGIPGYDPNREADYQFYVRCQDKKGNKNEREYAISFCLKPGDDLTPPRVLSQEPVSAWLGYGASSVSGAVVTNEPSECKWDTIDKGYFEMGNSFSCANELGEQVGLGWRCSATLPISQDEQTVFVRCRDQPWLNESEKRNVNQASYIMDFHRARTPLQISLLKPDNETITAGVQPLSVRVEVETEGGVDGTALCEYKIGSFWIAFSDTGGRKHVNLFNQLLAGNFSLPVRCRDVAGDVAERTAQFSLVLDTSAPAITRVYTQGGLVVVTDEPASCFYEIQSTSVCAAGTAFSGDQLYHSTNFDLRQTYSIYCKDRFENRVSGCALIVQAGAFNGA